MLEHETFIDEAMTSNDELTVRDLHYLLKETFSDLKVSQSSVKRSPQNLGWVSTVPIGIAN